MSEREHLTKCLDRCDVLTSRIRELEQRLAAAESRNAELQSALERARGSIKFWGNCAPVRTRKREGLIENLIAIDSVLNKAEAPGGGR